MNVPDELAVVLNGSGLSWEVEVGKKHRKVKLGGRLVAILPHGKEQRSNIRPLKNTIAQVRRALRSMQGAS